VVTFKSLESQGFILIPNFLTDDELVTVKKHYIKVTENFARDHSLKTDYNIINVAPDSDIQFIIDRIKEYVDRISNCTDITANTVDNEVGYIDNAIFGCQGWHQDHGPYFKWGDLYNSLNFWIAISKTDATNNGISLVPFDQFSNKIKSKFVGSGAKRFEIINKNTRVFDDRDNSVFVLPVDLDECSISPEISEKDLLIMRGDLIHKSQNLTKNRVSLSVRCYKKC
jgi:hypothetical protein